MEENSIHLFGLEFLEPGSFITDIFMAIAAFTFYHKLKYDKSTTYYSYFFLFMGLASIIGAFGHLLYNYTGKPLQIFGWIFSALSIYFIEMASITEIKSENLRKRLNLVINIQFILFMITIFHVQNFMVVTINTIVGLLGLVIPILGIQAFNKAGKKNILILSGILLSGPPAFLYRLNFSFSGLNGKEISHLILILCFYLIFLGVSLETVKEKAISRS